MITVGRARKERKWPMNAYNKKSNLLSRLEKFSLRKRLLSQDLKDEQTLIK